MILKDTVVQTISPAEWYPRKVHHWESAASILCINLEYIFAEAANCHFGLARLEPSPVSRPNIRVLVLYRTILTTMRREHIPMQELNYVNGCRRERKQTFHQTNMVISNLSILYRECISIALSSIWQTEFQKCERVFMADNSHCLDTEWDREFALQISWTGGCSWDTFCSVRWAQTWQE